MTGTRRRRQERQRMAKALARLRAGIPPRTLTPKEARERTEAAIERWNRKPRRDCGVIEKMNNRRTT